MTDPFAQRLADATLDRRRLKRRLVWWRAAAIVAIAVLVGGLGWLMGGTGADRLDATHIARLPIVGVIEDDRRLANHLVTLGNDDRVAAVIVAIDSPGGTFSGSEALYSGLLKLAEAKPTVAVLGGVAASGGYMAAVAADRIIARAGSVTGSVGVILQMPQMHRMLSDLGIDVETVRSGSLKAIPGPLEETPREARVATEALIADLFDQFLGMVVARRNLDGAALAEVRKGGVFTGRRGLELGLVDAIGGEEVAVQWLEDSRGIAPGLPVQDRQPETGLPWWEDALERLESRARLGVSPILDGPWAIWHQ
jgi:protease-4